MRDLTQSWDVRSSVKSGNDAIERSATFGVRSATKPGHLRRLRISPERALAFQCSRTERPRLVMLQPCKGRYANEPTRTAGRLTGPLKETPSAASNAVSHTRVRVRGFRLVKVRRETPKVPKARPSGDALYRQQAPERGLLSETQAEPATIGSMNPSPESEAIQNQGAFGCGRAFEL